MSKQSAAAFILIGGVMVAGTPQAHAAGYKSLYDFQAATDGASPDATVVNIGATLFGTTYFGGGCGSNTLGCGSVFSFNTTTGTEAVNYAFTGGSKGSSPSANLLNVSGILYGTTSAGGTSGKGTVFSLTAATGAEKVLYSFRGGTDGAGPSAGLIDVGGTLYGTTIRGGSKKCSRTGCGTVFTINPATGAEKVLYAFQGGADGAAPGASLISVGSMLYGTTTYGGSSSCGGTTPGCGTIFSVNTTTGAEKIVYSFRGGADGAGPYSALLSVNGTLYGTTSVGGGSANCIGGCGTVFSFNPTGAAETVLYAFTSAGDGQNPFGSLASLGSLLYGTTQAGGSGGSGTVFSLNPSTHAEAVLYSFEAGTDGANPTGLTGVSGTLYGTTTGGGSANCSGGCGTVFSYAP